MSHYVQTSLSAHNKTSNRCTVKDSEYSVPHAGWMFEGMLSANKIILYSRIK